MKKIIFSVITIVVALLLLISCGSENVSADTYAARAAYAVVQHPLEGFNDFTLMTAEYYEKDGMRKINMDCQLRFTDGRMERHVYLCGDGTGAIESIRSDLGYIVDETTGLFIVDFGDSHMVTGADIEGVTVVDVQNTLQIFQKFQKSKSSNNPAGDLSILGVEKE